jgi:predicted metalloendopeptidase
MHAKIAIPPFHNSVKPGQDFYKYVNGRWMASAPIPKYTSSYGISEEVDAQIDSVLLKDIDEYEQLAEIGREALSPEDKQRDAIGRLAMSALRQSKQINSVDYLKRGIRSMGCMRDTADIAKALGKMCRYKIKTVIDIDIYNLANTYHIHIGPGSMGLSDASYYSAVIPGKMNTLYSYTQLIKNVTKRLDIDDITSVIPVEARFAQTLDYLKNDTNYIDLRGTELKARYKHIPWDILFKEYGLDHKNWSYHIRVKSPDWLQFLNEQFEKLLTEQWYALFGLHTIIHALPFLPPPFDSWHFQFFEKLLRGQEIKKPQNILTLNIVKHKMSAATSYLFVKKYLTAEFKSQATHFVKKIIEAASSRMKDVDWFSKKTRAKAAEKIRAITPAVAYSESQMESPADPPALQTDNLLANIYLLDAAVTEESIRHLVKEPAKGFWDDGAHTVNAFYYHDTNEIVIPAGSFLWPFYDKSRLGWSYGGIGAIIGHEITHAFDEEGRAYNQSGEEKEWWSSDDLKAYKERTEALVRLYSEQKILDHAVNGLETLNENLADLGGLAIALDALKKEVAPEERLKELREFFVSYATSWRTKEHAQRKIQRLVLDKHAPIELRVNMIVSQFEEWYEAFDVRTGDHLYIPPEERIRIF